jgi:archaellum biogenesis ATPase FlaH
VNDQIKPTGPKKIIIQKLDLDKSQVVEYEKSIQIHIESIRNNETQMNHLRNELYKQLKYEQDSLILDSLISNIADQQAKAEWINYNHFLAIKKLCEPPQLEHFEELTEDIANLFSNEGRK